MAQARRRRRRARAVAAPGGGHAVEIYAAIGRRLKALRESRALRQGQVAEAARRFGLPWSQATVAAIETGRRRLFLHEALFLPTVLAQLTAWAPRPQLRDLIPSDEGTWIVIENALVRADFLAEEAFGRQRKPRPEILWLQYRHLPIIDADHRRAWRRVWGSEKAFDPDLMALAITDALGEAETHAAAKFDVTPALLALAARKQWGRSLTQERDRRAADRAGDEKDPRALQAIRGHVTRELLDELEPLLKEIRSRP
jgi:transcriptional regulator with XRE-family HTH domain